MGAILAYPVSNNSMLFQNWKSNALAEAYSRMKYLCELTQNGQ